MSGKPRQDVEMSDEEDLDLEQVEQEIYEAEQAEEAEVAEWGCCECGFINRCRDGHHAGIRCPHTGRCGQCGNDWPCKEHEHLAPKRSASRSAEGGK